MKKITTEFRSQKSEVRIHTTAPSAVFCILSAAVVACCLLLSAPASFAAGSADKGTASGQFLKLGAGARAAGMGEAYSAVADDASAVYWNPAALTRINGFSATFMHAALLADISYEFLGYGQKLGDSGALGAGIQYLSMPAFQETAASGFETGASFSPKDMGITLAYAYSLNDKYSIGIAGKQIRSQIDKSASTFAADLGILGAPGSLRGKELKLSFVVQNLTGKLKFDQEADPLPLNIKLGSSLALTKTWLIGLDVNLPADNSPYAALGAECRLGHGENTGFTGRAGFNSRTLGDIAGFSGISAGAGVDYKQFRLDYAFLPFGAIGMTHRLSVTVGFGNPENAGNEGSAVPEIPDTTPSGKGTPAAQVWLRQIKSLDWEKRVQAAIELGKMKAAEAVGPLLGLLDDESPKVGSAAAQALGLIGDRQALKPLLRKLEDESAYLRASAVKALGDLGDKGAIKALKTKLKDDSEKVRKAVKEALKKLRSAP